jgi:hypothetical protein
MYLYGYYHRGCNRRFYEGVGDDATIVLTEKDNGKTEVTTITLKGGNVVDREKVIKSSRGKKTKERYVYDYGNKFKKYVDDKLVEEKDLSSCGNILRDGSTTDRWGKAKLFGRWGKIQYKYTNGYLRREIFTYNNGTLGYDVSVARHTTKVFYDNGKVAVEGNFRPNIRPKGFWQVIDSWLKGPIDNIRELTRSRWTWTGSGVTYNATHYDRGGKVKTTMFIDKGQLSGKGKVDYKAVYYIHGEPVSEQLYNASPDDIDPYEVLALRNAQTRATYLSKIGFERLLAKTEAKVLHKDTESDSGGTMTLFEIPFPWADETKDITRPQNADDVMRLLQVTCPSTGEKFVLRTPPDIDKCMEAKRWTMVIPTDGEGYKIVVET